MKKFRIMPVFLVVALIANLFMATPIVANAAGQNAVTFGSYFVSNENIITNVQPNTSVLDFKSNLTIAPTAGLSFKDYLDNPLSDGDKIATGAKLQVNANNSITNYTIIVYGDVSGDGLINISDLVSIRNDLLETTPLLGAFKVAGDIYNEDAVTLNSLAGVMAAVSENGTISQNPGMKRQVYEIESFDFSEWVTPNMLLRDTATVEFNSNSSFIKDGSGSLKLTAPAIGFRYWPGVVLPNPSIKDVTGSTSISYWIFNDSNSTVNIKQGVTGYYNVDLLPNQWTNVTFPSSAYWTFNESNISGFGFEFVKSELDTSTTVLYVDSFVVNGASSAKDITEFNFISPSSAGTINGTNINLTVAAGTDITALVANFTKLSEHSTVSVNGTIQTSGQTVNDFTNPVSYTVTAQDGSTKNYIVTVNIRQTYEIESFDNVAWVTQDMIFGSAYETLEWNSDPRFIKDGGGSLKLTAPAVGAEHWPGVQLMNPAIKDVTGYDAISFWIYNDSEQDEQIVLEGIPWWTAYKKSWTMITLNKHEYASLPNAGHDISGLKFYFTKHSADTSPTVFYIDSYVVNGRAANEIESFDIAAWVTPETLFGSTVSTVEFNSNPAFIKDGSGSLKLTAPAVGAEYWPGVQLINPAIKDVTSYNSISFWIYNDTEEDETIVFQNIPWWTANKKSWTKITLDKHEFGSLPNAGHDISGLTFYVTKHSTDTSPTVFYIDSFQVN